MNSKTINDYVEQDKNCESFVAPWTDFRSLSQEDARLTVLRNDPHSKGLPNYLKSLKYINHQVRDLNFGNKSKKHRDYSHFPR